jgi:hypothetical protein
MSCKELVWRTAKAMALKLHFSTNSSYKEGNSWEQRRLETWERKNWLLYSVVMDLIYALTGNSSVNTVQHATRGEAVFFVVRATPSAENGPMNLQYDTNNFWHQMYNIWLLMDANCNLLGYWWHRSICYTRLFTTLLAVITISLLQWVLTLWCLVSEWSLDLFFRMLAANWLNIGPRHSSGN